MMKHSSEPGKAQSTRDKFNVASIQNVDAASHTVRIFFITNRLSQMLY